MTMAKTSIEWTQRVWNPIAGCSVVSPGCTNCYAMRMAARIERMGVTRKYDGLTRPTKAGPVWTGQVRLDETTLREPLSWRKPCRVFVNSMSDLFHGNVADETIDKVFAVMALCPQHTFQVLTKRADRMRDYMQQADRRHPGYREQAIGIDVRFAYRPISQCVWPLPNVWIGVSVEDQVRADERIPLLLDTPAAVRWVSAEPLLGPLDLYNGDPDPRLGGHRATATYLGRWKQPDDGLKSPERQGVDWIVAGGESGPNARPCHPDWIRSLRDQCAAADVPFFYKQRGAWRSILDRDKSDPDWRAGYSRYAQSPRHRFLNLAGGCGFHGDRLQVMERDTATTHDALLDGREHREYPA
jgi:protein gp37